MRVVLYHKRLHGHHNHDILEGADPEIFHNFKKQFYMGLIDNKVVAVGHIRKRLNIFTLIKGGNLDLCVLKKHRGKGYGDKFMFALLVEADRLGMKDLLVTCKKTHKWTQYFLDHIDATKVLGIGARDYYMIKLGNIKSFVGRF